MQRSTALWWSLLFENPTQSSPWTNSRASPAASRISSSRASSRHIDRFCLSQDVPPANVVPALLYSLAFDQVHLAPQDGLQCLFHIQEAFQPRVCVWPQ